MSSVSYRAARLVSLPNFENVRFEFEASLSVKPGETCGQTWDRAVALVDARLNKVISEFQAALAKKVKSKSE